MSNLREFIDSAIRGTEQTRKEHPADVDYWDGFLRALQAVRERIPDQPAERCTGISTRHGSTCVQWLAEGWVTVCDLCPRCTRRFMAALDSAAAADEPLAWHRAYRERARP
jgi:hypothetical protein